ncbi:HPP family protein [Protofrankia symbiont of Coriaria ruscifolia]|uniref:HPP family protein n=1 Tax=Protofrankia symbiont of Coriaria ruscifolia TaxID=1306542 RepID=UPI001A950997|nr:HPP family protein [Protofrankia symbiont of Coriaria ruscifolia]
MSRPAGSPMVDAPSAPGGAVASPGTAPPSTARSPWWRSGAPPAPRPWPILLATATSVSALLLLVAVGSAIDQTLLIPPLAASAALVMAAPALPLAQPRNVVGGQFASALVGVAVGALAGHSAWAGAVAGGLAVGVMLLLRMSHSPAAATAVLVTMQAPDAVRFLLLLVLATALMIVVGIVGARVARKGTYPSYWW